MKKTTIGIVCIFLLCSYISKTTRMTIQNLRCEYLYNPVGVDTEHPRFTWQLTAETSGVKLRACQILVGRDSAKVAEGKADFWNSGSIKTSALPIVYSGPALHPFTRYYWRVKMQRQNGAWSSLSEIAFFETGMMKQNNWKGEWITDTPDFNVKPAPYFRREFNIQKRIKSAKLYIAAAGLYELYLNGKRVGNHQLDPMFTRFDRRTLYVTYDVTKNLKADSNAVGVLLGNGWYNHQSTAVWYFDKAPWRARPKFCVDLRIIYADNTEEIITSNGDWKTTHSPIIFNSIYTGEHYDSRLEQPGWNEPGFDDSTWKKVIKTGAPSKNITAQVLHPIRDAEKIPVKEMVKFNDQDYVFNFGRNFAGVSELTVTGESGTIVRLKHGEQLDKNGHVDQSNINIHYRPTDDSDPFQTDIVILSGKNDKFKPKFNYKGFQYVEITSDKPVILSKESLFAYFMHSDVPMVGEINSSNQLLNELWQASNASYLSNFFGYPTDCPHREKNGWTGDARINTENGLYNFDGITVYEKWLADHRDEQQPNGIFPAIVPSDGWGYHWANGPDWTSTIAFIPWNIYLFYGDSRLLEDCYNNIKLYVDHIDEISPTGLTDWGLGDWIPVKSKAPREFTSSVYFYLDATILAKAAKLFGKQIDYEKYSALAKKIKQAINAKYFSSEKEIYGEGSQTELSFALMWGLIPNEHRAKVAENLVKRVLADDSHIDVGLLGSQTILNALSENGYADLAYRVATQEAFPSWGWWIKNGASTFFENWRIEANDSRNHPSFGEINAWFYKALGGIYPDETCPGFKNIILKPNFVEGLTQFEAKHESPYGTIVSSWEKLDGEIVYKVTIPTNSTATLFLQAKVLKESDRNILGNRNIEVIQNKEYKVQLQLKSGFYSFKIVKSRRS